MFTSDFVPLSVALRERSIPLSRLASKTRLSRLARVGVDRLDIVSATCIHPQESMFASYEETKEGAEPREGMRRKAEEESLSHVAFSEKTIFQALLGEFLHSSDASAALVHLNEIEKFLLPLSRRARVRFCQKDINGMDDLLHHFYFASYHSSICDAGWLLTQYISRH